LTEAPQSHNFAGAVETDSKRDNAIMPLHLWIEDAVFLLALSIAVPGVAVAIGYAAWLGKPKNWDRSLYWTAFVVSAPVSVPVMVWAQRMRIDLTSWWHLLQLSIFGLGALLFGVAGGCVLSVFTYGRGRGPFWRGATTSSENSSENVESDRNSSI